MNQRGVALLAVLLVVALVTVLAVGLAHSNLVRLGLAERRAESAQAWQVWQAGVEWARDILREDQKRGAYDHPGEFWARGIRDYPAEGGLLSGVMQDQHGLFNLNNLARPGADGEAERAAFARLLIGLGLEAGLADSLADWVDADRVPREGGAEDAWYAGLEPPGRAANRPLRHLAELYRVRGFEPAVIERLRPQVTVLPEPTPVNVNTAPPELLTALLPEVEPGLIEALATRRVETPFTSLDEFRRALPAGISVDAKRLTVASQYYLVRLAVRLGGTRAEGEALLHRGGGLPTVVWRARGLAGPLVIDAPVDLNQALSGAGST